MISKVEHKQAQQRAALMMKGSGIQIMDDEIEKN
jgi:hypothetical protein